MPLMVSISGIRGIVGESLTPDVVVKYAGAFAEYCHHGRIVIGRDGRVTGKIIGNIVSSTLFAAGCDVVAIGIAPTPTVALAVEQLSAAGGISITASHNPIQWNGLKFIGSSVLHGLDQRERRFDVANAAAKFFTDVERNERACRLSEPFGNIFGQGRGCAVHCCFDGAACNLKEESSLGI